MTTHCARCGTDPAPGHAFIGDDRYCHGDVFAPTCYELAVEADCGFLPGELIPDEGIDA